MTVILCMVLGAVLAAALALVRNFPSFLLPDHCTGELRSLNHAPPRTIEVDCADHPRQKFFIADDIQISTPTQPVALLQDLNAGDRLTIHFTRRGDDFWAQSITLHQ